MKSLALIVALAALPACQKKDAAALPPPHKELVQAMIEYCKIDQLPRDQWRDAQRAWGFQNGGNANVMVMWNAAARDKKPDAIKTVRAAATAAMGGDDKCPILDVLDRPERVPPKEPAGSAATP